MSTTSVSASWLAEVATVDFYRLCWGLAILTTKLDAGMCRHAFDDAVEALSRVASYATSRNQKIGEGEFTMIGPELCKRDILILAISLRRLAELTQMQSCLRGKIIMALRADSDSVDKDTVWNIIGNIIHSVSIEIISKQGILEYRIGVLPSIYDAVMKKKEIDAVAILKSDNHGTKLFKLIEFCSLVNEAIEEMNEFMGNNGVFLGSGYDY